MTTEPVEDAKPENPGEESPESSQPRAKRDLVFQPEFLEDLQYWVETDRKTALKVLSLMDQIRRDPFSGTGRPEQLKHWHENAWSRRLTQEHRIVYLVSDDRIDFLQARYHY